MASQAWNLIGQHLPTVKEFVNATDNGWSRSQLRRMDRLLGDAKSVEAAPTCMYLP